jgi:hypothetical protein
MQMAQSQQQPQVTTATPQLTYVDRPEVSETFADSMWRVNFENSLVKMEFAVNRMDDPNGAAAPTGRVMTACRIVIPLAAMMDMLGKLQAMLTQLQAAGVIRPIIPPSPTGRPN